MFSRIFSLIRKEFVQIRRDPRTLALIIMMPLVQLVLFGFAINTTVDHLPTVVNDQARDRTSRELIAGFANSGYFDIVGVVDSQDEAREAVDNGQAKVAIIVPPTYGRDLAAGHQAQVQVLIDGSDPNVAQTALFSAGNIAQSRSIDLVSRNRGVAIPIDVRPIVLYNPGMQSVNFMIPGLIGLIVQFQTLIMSTLAVVRERERGTLEQLIVTPVRPFELMIGKLLPYTLIAFLNIGMVLGAGVAIFQVDVVGSVWLLLGLSVLFVMASLGIGLLISTVSQTQAQAVQLALFIMLPSVLLSGFMFPREGMPRPLADLGNLIPLTFFLQILRGIILKGVGFEPLVNVIAPLAVFGFGVFSIAVSRFRKRLV